MTKMSAGQFRALGQAIDPAIPDCAECEIEVHVAGDISARTLSVTLEPVGPFEWVYIEGAIR